MEMKKKRHSIDAIVPEGFTATRVGTILPASSGSERKLKMK